MRMKIRPQSIEYKMGTKIRPKSIVYSIRIEISPNPQCIVLGQKFGQKRNYDMIQSKIHGF